MIWGAVWYGGRSPFIRFDASESTTKRKGKWQSPMSFLTIPGVNAEIYRTQITEGPLINSFKRVKAIWRDYGLPWVAL